MYSFGQDLTPEEREELKHAQLLDALGYMACSRHGEHSHWQGEVLLKVHNRVYGEPHDCRYCGPNETARVLEDLQKAWKRPSNEPKAQVKYAPPEGYDTLPESVKRQLQKMNINPERVRITDGVLFIKSE